jgi:formylmethanofuran dehydrogenase subunit E
MKDLQHYIDAAAKDGPPRAGIVLAIRMCLLALKRLEIDDLTGQKRRLVVVVETDRCLPDAVQLVTGCRLGNRTLKLKDRGKMAAAFIDLRSNRAIRLAARESANQEITRLSPNLERLEALSLAYRTLTDEELYHEEWVRVRLAPEDLPGYRAPRVICVECGEGIGFHREVQTGGRIVCRTCAGERYYDPL